MSELADLLELLHGAGSRWKTVRLADDALGKQ